MESNISKSVNGIVHDSSERFDYYIFAGEERGVLTYLEYIGNVFEESKHRPLYVIKDMLNR